MLQARQSLKLLQKLNVDLTDHARGARDHWCIQANMSAMAQFLTDDLADCSKSHPEVRPNLEKHLTTKIIEVTPEGAIAISVIIEQPHCEDLQVFRCRSDQRVVIAPVGTAAYPQRQPWSSDAPCCWPRGAAQRRFNKPLPRSPSASPPHLG